MLLQDEIMIFNKYMCVCVGGGGALYSEPSILYSRGYINVNTEYQNLNIWFSDKHWTSAKISYHMNW
jgi:hypothetical protein